jgi:hypothetical protein
MVLYVYDDATIDQGSIAGGWELTITTTGCISPTPAPTPSTATISGKVTYCFEF